ncbi:hypothetical protein OXIME_001464 [Oxyplasma meridianum]|uniref:Uncharacterized protein n=1 Tax=Oxyplasma meridianum TaxID=3073602 RepID=A0AAX4NHN0_9ARCH
MSAEEELKSIIESSRKISQDGTLVTYDLTSGIDFSNPKAVAKALSDVFFEKDAINWFKVNDDKIDFVPTYKVRVVMKEEHNKKLESTVDDFLKDLQKDGISKDYSKQIKKGSIIATQLQSAMAKHALESTLFKHSLDKVYEDSIRDDLFVDLLEKLEIRSLSGKDLIDWNKLPL